MARVAAAILTYLLLASCSETSIIGVGGYSKGSPSQPTQSQDQEDKSDSQSGTVDEPVAVGGSYLFCAPNLESANQSDFNYGCRFQNKKKEKILLAAGIAASATVTDVNGTRPAGVLNKPDSHYWTWIVNTASASGPASGKFKINMQLSGVSVKTTDEGIEVTPGNDKYVLASQTLQNVAIALNGQWELLNDLGADNIPTAGTKSFLSVVPARFAIANGDVDPNSTSSEAGSLRLVLTKNDYCDYEAKNTSDVYYTFVSCSNGGLPGTVFNFTSDTSLNIITPPPRIVKTLRAFATFFEVKVAQP